MSDVNQVLDRLTQPRMPWHDVACCFTGPAVADVAWHFVQRWNYHSHDKNNDQRPLVPAERMVTL
ncbi:hypothetical protein T492DRAFT_888733 [Pavlovales sp. CCMP2436]|nr:hypothetical protein T492DRAFT_888733 [Pavlovales sp. CCMP2436]